MAISLNIRTPVPPDSSPQPKDSSTAKDIPRIPTIMADGFSFIRDIAKELIENVSKKDQAPIIMLAIHLAEWAESDMKNFSGAEKKEMVIKLLLWAIENQEDVLLNVLGENEDELYSLVKNVVPSVLDMVVAASRGKLNLNHIKQVSKTCISWCC